MAKKHSYPVFYDGMRRRSLVAVAQMLQLESGPSSSELLAALREHFADACAKRMGLSLEQFRGML